MRLGMSLYADNIGEKINAFEFADYIETNIPDGPMTELEPHRDRIKVIPLPDLNNRCHEKLVRAFELGIEKAVVHYFTFKEAAQEWKIAELRILTTFAEKNSIKLCLENTEDKPEEIEEILRKVPGLKFCLDIGHANLFNNTPLGFVYHLRDHLSHIHDNNGGDSEVADIHLAPGEGNIDFDQIFNALKTIDYDQTITLEMTPMDSLERKAESLRRVREMIHKNKHNSS